MPDTATAVADLQERVSEAQASLTQLAQRAERAVQDGLEQLRAQSKVYAESGRQQLDTAGRYATNQVQEHPLGVTLAAVGVGVLIGFLLSTGSRR